MSTHTVVNLWRPTFFNYYSQTSSQLSLTLLYRLHSTQPWNSNNVCSGTLSSTSFGYKWTITKVSTLFAPFVLECDRFLRPRQIWLPTSQCGPLYVGGIKQHDGYSPNEHSQMNSNKTLEIVIKIITLFLCMIATCSIRLSHFQRPSWSNPSTIRKKTTHEAPDWQGKGSEKLLNCCVGYTLMNCIQTFHPSGMK